MKDEYAAVRANVGCRAAAHSSIGYSYGRLILSFALVWDVSFSTLDQPAMI